MPLVFRLVGRTVGKISGLVQGGRARMAQMSKGNDLLQVRIKLMREGGTPDVSTSFVTAEGHEAAAL